MIKNILLALFFLTAGTSVIANENNGAIAVSPAERVVVAYVTSWSSVIPDPFHMTHINYAFGHVNETFDGVRVDNPDRLRTMVALKKLNPQLKVLISIGGWGSGRFSEMASDEKLRHSFASDCSRLAEEFGLDGIDIDWEYPTVGSAGISFSEYDTENFTLLMSDIRNSIGEGKLLTMATIASGDYFDLAGLVPVVDFVNIMTYDMGGGKTHHSGLYRSDMTNWICCDEAVKAHIDFGFPVDRLVLGIPFYGRATADSGLEGFTNYSKLTTVEGISSMWDEGAEAPYMVNQAGEVICTFDDPRSIAVKCDYLHSLGMKGAMYWDYAGDDDNNTLRNAVFEGVMLK